MENQLIQELKDALALSASYKSAKHPNAEAIVMASQASVRATLDELDTLRAQAGEETPTYVIGNGSVVTGARAAQLLDDEMKSHEDTRAELRQLMQAALDQEFTAQQLVKENQMLREKLSFPATPPVSGKDKEGEA